MSSNFSGLRASGEGRGGGGEGGDQRPQRRPPHERQRHQLWPGNQDRHPPDPKGERQEGRFH